MYCTGLYCDFTVMYCAHPTLHRENRVASGFEFSVCLSVLCSLSVCSLFVLIKFSNLFILTKHRSGSIKCCENEYRRIGIVFGGGLTAGWWEESSYCMTRDNIYPMYLPNME